MTLFFYKNISLYFSCKGMKLLAGVWETETGRWKQIAKWTHNFLNTLCYLQSFTSFLPDETHSTGGRLWAMAPCSHSGPSKLKTADWPLTVAKLPVSHVAICSTTWLLPLISRLLCWCVRQLHCLHSRHIRVSGFNIQHILLLRYLKWQAIN